MTVLNVLLSFVDSLSASPTSLQASLFLVFVSVLLQFISLSTHNWLDLNSQIDESEGLWKHCREVGEYTCCESVERHIFNSHANVPGNCFTYCFCTTK